MHIVCTSDQSTNGCRAPALHYLSEGTAPSHRHRVPERQERHTTWEEGVAKGEGPPTGQTVLARREKHARRRDCPVPPKRRVAALFHPASCDRAGRCCRRLDRDFPNSASLSGALERSFQILPKLHGSGSFCFPVRQRLLSIFFFLFHLGLVFSSFFFSLHFSLSSIFFTVPRCSLLCARRRYPWQPNENKLAQLSIFLQHSARHRVFRQGGELWERNFAAINRNGQPWLPYLSAITIIRLAQLAKATYSIPICTCVSVGERLKRKKDRQGPG